MGADPLTQRFLLLFSNSQNPVLCQLTISLYGLPLWKLLVAIAILYYINKHCSRIVAESRINAAQTRVMK